jgi:hypothetical protein
MGKKNFLANLTQKTAPCRGNGFEPLMSYTLRVTSEKDPEQELSIPARFPSSSLGVDFTIPRWPYHAQTVKVTLRRNDTNATSDVMFADESPPQLKLAAGWIIATMPHGGPLPDEMLFTGGETIDIKVCVCLMYAHCRMTRCLVKGRRLVSRHDLNFISEYICCASGSVRRSLSISLLLLIYSFILP